MVISPIHYIAIPLLVAFLIPLVAKLGKQWVRILPGAALAYLVFVSAYLMMHVQTSGMINETISGWEAPIGINLVFSPLSGLLVSIITGIGFLVWLYSIQFKNVESGESQKYFTLLLLLITGANGVILTGDIFNMFVFMEITAISAYGLTAFYRHRNGAEAAFKYLLVGSLASVFMLLAIMLLYTQVGTLNIAEIASKMDQVSTGMKTTIFILFFVGFGIESEMFPLNGWAPDAYTEVPGPVAAVFASAVVKAGVYAMARMVFTLFGYGGSAIELLIIMGILTMLIAEISAFRQEKLKRMLAYSSIGQMGLVLAAFGLGTKAGVFAAIFIMVNHALIKSLLFLSGTYMVFHSKNKLLSEMNGIAKELPFTAAIFAFGVLALVGFPPFTGFWSKMYFLIAAADQQMVFLIISVLLITSVEVVYYFKVINRMYFLKPEYEFEYKRPTWNAYISMIVLVVVILMVSFFPSTVTGLIDAAADDLMNRTEYINLVLNK